MDCSLHIVVVVRSVFDVDCGSQSLEDIDAVACWHLEHHVAHM